jgi:hypothetical protein
MKTVFKRISEIREKIENKNFDIIYDYLFKNNLNLSKENFDVAISKLGLISNNSYCKYTYFLKKYIIKKKQWK